MIDYKKLGFKSGLEIHQQLKGRKLFCNCPALLRKDKPHFTIKRQLRPMAGETGEVDVAAVFERKKQLYYIYEGYRDTTCLVELDEEPPHLINKDALNTAITVALMFNCEIMPTVQVMRKTVVDGSNVSGFQRTALVGANGYIETSFGRVGVHYVILEEEAARRTAEDKESVTFRLDRLGIPLLEIVTAPDMKTPEQVKEVASKIGSMLRATGNAMRGIGTIRQDINVSIKGHCRVELKGVQDLRDMQKHIDSEILRQQKNMKEIQHVRNVKSDYTSKYLRPLPGAARMYPETDIPLIQITNQKISQLKKNLPEMPEERAERYEKLRLNPDIIKQLISSEYTDWFDEFVLQFKNINPTVIATTILQTSKEVQKKLGQPVGEFSKEQLKEMLELVDNGALAKDAIFDIMMLVAQGEEVSNAASKFKKLSHAELVKEVEKIKSKYKGLPPGALIGKAMAELKGRADGKKIVELLSN